MKATSLRITLLCILLAAAALYFFQNHEWGQTADSQTTPPTQKPKPLNLDEETKAAIRTYFDGVTVLPEENSVQYAIRLDHGRGRKEIAAGNHKSAYDTYRKVLAISYNQGSLMGVAIGLGVLSNIVHDMGNTEDAIRLAFLEYKVAKASNNPFEYGVSEQRIAALLEQADHSMSMAWRLRAKASLKGTPHRQDYVILLNTLALDLQWLGENNDALNAAEEAWQLATTLGDTPGHKEARARAADTLAALLEQTGQCERAIAVLNAVIPTFAEAEKKTKSYYGLLQRLAACHRRIGNEDRAKQYYAAAYSHYEANRAAALGDRARAKLDRSSQALANHLIDAFIGENNLFAALALLETNKARTLADIHEDSGQQAIYRQWTALQQRHAQERLALFETGTQRETLEQELAGLVDSGESDALWEQYDRLLQRQSKERQETRIALQIRNVAVSEPLTEEKIRSVQQQLDPTSAIFSLYLNFDRLSAFVLTREGLSHWTTDLSYEDARRTVEELQTTLTNPYFDFYREPAQRLANALIDPLIEHLNPEIEQLIYSPDDLFSGIPLGVLPVGEQRLAQRFVIARVPSLRAVTFADTRSHPTQGISCVDPQIRGARLPFQRDTGSLLQQLYGEKLTGLIGEACSPPHIVAAIEQQHTPSFLHIGAHGLFYRSDPMQSGIFLSAEDGDGDGALWNAKAMGTIDFGNLELITFASCEAGTADADFSRDIFGILRTVLFSGAKSVVAPLWAVQDQATSQFMQEFYRAYAQGLAPEEAMQQVQREFIASKELSHPYYWSGFFVMRGAI